MSQGYRWRKPAPCYITRSLEHADVELPVDVYMLRHDGFRRSNEAARLALIRALINDYRGTVRGMFKAK